MDRDQIRLAGQPFEVVVISRENGPTRLRRCDEDRIHRGPPSAPKTKLACSPGQSFGQLLNDVASLQQRVDAGVIPLSSSYRLGQHDRRNDRRPKAIPNKYADGGRGILVALGQVTEPAGIHDEHCSACFRGMSPCPHPLRERLGSGNRGGRRFPDLINQLGQVAVRLGEKVLATKLSPYSPLQKLRGGKPALLGRPIQVFWKIHLEAWHTPKYTPPSFSAAGSKSWAEPSES